MAEKEKKIQIIKAAAKRFDRHGLNKTTLDEIARDLRIGKATIYHYFESKDRLYFDVLEWEGALLLDEIKAIWENGELNLKQKLETYFSSKENLQTKYKLIFDSAINILNDKSFEFENSFYSQLITKEEHLLNGLLTGLIEFKSGSQNEVIKMLVAQSWSFLFAGKLKLSGNEEKHNELKALQVKITEEKFFIIK